MNQTCMALGKRIRKLREKAGLTQEQLAEKAELSLKHLGELERGRGNPSLSSIEHLARALGLPFVEICDCEHERLSVTQLRTELHRLIDTANDEQCRQAYRILKALWE